MNFFFADDTLQSLYSLNQQKEEYYEEYINMYDLNPDQIIYMGDDVPDLAVMRRVGLPVCPHNAAPEILSVAKYISPFKGGEGCARDVIEKVLRLNGHWEEE